MTSSNTTPTTTATAQEHHHHTPYQQRQEPIVTQEQLNRCARYIDEATGDIFYRVQSESDPDKEYTVRALKKNGKYYPTCTYPAGEQGTACKHVRWAKAHAKEYWRLREAATEIIDRREHHGRVEYTVRDETGYNLVRLGRTPQEDHCYCPESIPMAVPCHHLRVVRRAERLYHDERARYDREIA